MGTRDPRVDAYIASVPPFARPILTHIREVVHAALPAVREEMKWSRPHFTHHGLLCGMSAFKAHCALGFWRGAAIEGMPARGGDDGEGGMGQFGRLTSVADLPPDDVLAGYVRAAAALNERGEKTTPMGAPRTKAPRAALPVPDDMAAAIAADRRAKAAFDAFPPSHRREYVEWVTEAKTAATRERRLAQAVEWIAEGKSRNWKYERAGKG